MKTAHEIRNWLHYMVLAAQAADPHGVAQGFAREHPLEVTGPGPDERWESWEEWHAFLEQTMGPLRIGQLHLRLTQPPQITLSDSLPEATVYWQVAYRLVHLGTTPTLLDCEAKLVVEQQRWVAYALHCQPPAAFPLREEGA